MRLLFLVVSLALAALSLLTAFKAPTVFTWKLALLAGEFGHFFGLLALLIAGVLMVRGADDAPWRHFATLVACGGAAALFFKPVAQAARLGGGLPGELARAFGDVPVERKAFSLRALVAAKSGAGVTPEARVFAHAGTAEALTLDFYRAGKGKPAPCVIVVHGGGWDSGERSQLAALNPELARLGFAVAAVSYRLAPAAVWPAQRDDVRAAVAYLKKHATELGIDPARLVLLGRSAGGHIAQAVAYDKPDPAIRGVIALYAPADLHFAWKHTSERDVLDSFKLIRQLTGGTPETAAEAFDSASPYLQVKRGTVPTLLMHGTIDSLVWRRQSERLAEKLREQHVPHAFIELPWATHAFDVNPRGPGGQLSTFAIEWFLRAVTR
jgi:acetyl esterase/lipase